MVNQKKFRTVNRILGQRPKLGPFPADQILPWSLIGMLNLIIFQYTLKAGWLATSLSIGWGWATWWVISSNKDFFGKFVGVPRISRGYMHFHSLKPLNIELRKNQNKSKDSGVRTQKSE